MIAAFSACASRPRNRCGLPQACGKARRWGADQPVDRSSETSRRQLLFGKVRCRQPEKILFPPELAVFTAELHQFSAFLAGQWALAGTTELTAIDTGLTDPLSQAAHWNTEALGHSSAGQPLSQGKGNSFLLLLRCEPPACTGWVGHQSTVWWSWRFSCRPVHQTGGSPLGALVFIAVNLKRFWPNDAMHLHRSAKGMYAPSEWL